MSYEIKQRLALSSAFLHSTAKLNFVLLTLAAKINVQLGQSWLMTPVCFALPGLRMLGVLQRRCLQVCRANAFCRGMLEWHSIL